MDSRKTLFEGVCQNPDGYLWVATLDGLARFDGVRFTVFSKATSPGIASSRFASLDEDFKGDLWLSTEGSGVTRYHQDVFTTYTTQNGLPHNAVRAVTEMGHGHIWALSTGVIDEWQPATGRFVDITPRDWTTHGDPSPSPGE